MAANVPALTAGDPTARTMEASEKAVANLKELLERDIAAVRAEAVALKDLSKAQVEALRSVVDKQFEGNDKALSAALEAQKNSADKAEAGMTKLVDGIMNTLAVVNKANDERFADLKDGQSNLMQLITAMANRGAGKDEGTTTAIQQTDRSAYYIFGSIGALLGVIGIVAAIVAFTARTSGVAP